MKRLIKIKVVLLLGSFLLSFGSYAQNADNWTEKQLLEPSHLATVMTAQKDVPVIISVGPGAPIPNSVKVGMTNNSEGLEKLKAQLAGLAKDTKIIVYCGCCPFEHCPNIRPAIDVLKQTGFTNYYLLNLPHNIKRDWIDKGYPVAKP